MNRLRVAFLAGTLGRGGAEKQLVYSASALADAGADVRVYTLRSGEANSGVLAARGLGPIPVSPFALPPARLAAFSARLAGFRPHVVQAGHFFTNLYVAGAARVVGAAGIGAVRSDVRYELDGHGAWGGALLRAPADLIANSWAGKHGAEAAGRRPESVHVVPNVIDLAQHDAVAAGPKGARRPGVVVMAVGSLLPVKRLDRFLSALKLARERCAELRGVVVGDGPERLRLEELAGTLELGPDVVEFRGARDDVPAELAGADILALTSAHEGFPNAILEAMAGRLPVIAMQCGDVSRIVTDGTTGYVVADGDVRAMADRLVVLAGAPELRRRLGEAGRQAAARSYSSARLHEQLLATYRMVAERRRLRGLAAALA